MIPKAFLAGVVFLCALEARAVESLFGPDEHIALACTGMMISGEGTAAGSRIIADGTVDLVNRQVRGFGIGGAPIVFVSSIELRFGSSPAKVESGAHTIEGSINRTTGKTRVAVRLSKDPERILIRMDLDCRLTPSVS